METRNIIKSGPSTYVVSLPSDWIKRHNLGKGDFLYLEEKNSKLLYSASAKTIEDEEVFTINIDGKTSGEIIRLFNSAYIRNYHSFVFQGESVNKRAKEIRDLANSLVAVEIMEQSSSKIVAQEMLDKTKNSPQKIIRRMDMIIRGFFEDIEKSLENEKELCCMERENDVNRLCMLGQRLLFNALENPGYLADTEMSPTDILIYFKIIESLELISDSIMESSKFVHKIKNKEGLGKLFKKLRAHYFELMEIYFKNDKNKAITQSIEADRDLEEYEAFLDKNKEISALKFINPLREVIILVGEIALVVLNRNT